MIGWFADHQDGSVAAWQLLPWGVTRDLIALRLRTGRLRPLHHGVFAVGHVALTPRGHAIAAVLAGGPGAGLALYSAGASHAVRPHNGRRHHIVVPRSRRARTTARLQVHRPRTMPELCTIDGIPVTTLERTLLDLAATVPANQLRAALVRAEQRQVLDAGAIHAAVDRQPTHRGAGRLLAALGAHDPAYARTDGELERRFLQLVLGARLPTPEVNVPFGPYKVDFLWREQRLVVETDGGSHRTPTQQRADARRDRFITRTHRLLRFTWADVADRAGTVAEVRERLGAAQ